MGSAALPSDLGKFFPQKEVRKGGGHVEATEKALRMRERKHRLINSWKTWNEGNPLTQATHSQCLSMAQGERAINNEMREKNPTFKETQEMGMGETQSSSTIHSIFGNKDGSVVPTNMAQQRPFCPGIYHFINL